MVMVAALGVGMSMAVVQTRLLIVGVVGNVIVSLAIGFVIVNKGSRLQDTHNALIQWPTSRP